MLAYNTTSALQSATVIIIDPPYLLRQQNMTKDSAEKCLSCKLKPARRTYPRIEEDLLYTKICQTLRFNHGPSLAGVIDIWRDIRTVNDQ